MGYIHGSVKHKKHFVKPETGVHTNHVGCFWASIKKMYARGGGAFRKRWTGLEKEREREREVSCAFSYFLSADPLPKVLPCRIWRKLVLLHRYN